jgi:quercetin dioxygenase-like cupin family protein
MTGPKESHNSPRQSETLTRLPELGDKVIRRNINQELEKLKDAPSWQLTAGRSSETIVKYPDFRIVLVCMKPGSYMSHHRAEGPISVQVVHGRLRIHLPEDRTEDLSPGDLLTLEHGLEHDVEALEESSFLLSIAWPESAAADHA